ncbi:hypothetical protein MtrunA17_Chr6g0475881 [Medicago truncatula]|uniref:Uncharacterized protein n=1 Tax=Medicago truncatula TaxID=3880 RepID=A0A396HJK3_MEDTR|nr:hypothetical protein MtrunA17_Chr6g0475881 [Medicago truncatula]
MVRRKPDCEVILGAVKLNSRGLYKALQINKRGRLQTLHRHYMQQREELWG